MVMAGLERPDAGRVLVEGTDLVGLDEDALARFRGRRIGIVFQSFHLVPTMTALENVALPLELADRPGAHERARAELEAVGLGHRLHHYPAQLSGGEQQRVAIARAVAPDPAILVADEPTGNLDETTGRQIVDLLFRLKRDRGATLVLVTHDNGLARLCDRTVRLRSGVVEEPVQGRSRHEGAIRCTVRSPPAARPSRRMPLILRLALRELRGGLSGFGVFLACIALGVAAIAGIASVSRSLSDGLGREGRRIIGGDLSYSLINREATEQERAVLGKEGGSTSSPPCGPWRWRRVATRRWWN